MAGLVEGTACTGRRVSGGDNAAGDVAANFGFLGTRGDDAPGLAILLTVLAFNLMGDGLRDALDPKLKQ